MQKAQKRTTKGGKARAGNPSSAAVRRRTFPSRRSTRSLIGNYSGTQVSQSLAAPIASGVIQRKFFGLRFDRAAPHDEFPEGGLRIAGCLPYGASTLTNPGAFVQDTVKFGCADTGGLASIGISPTGAIVTGTCEAMFDVASPLCVFAQYFRRFRFRKLGVDYTSEVSPGVSTAAAGAGLIVQVAHESDIVTAEQASASYTMDTAIQSKNCTRFAAWTNSIVCPIITENRQSNSDELFYCTGAGDSLAAAGDAALRQCFQGAITATVSAVNSSADLVIGKVLIEFVVDLYGFTNLAVGVLPNSTTSRGVRRRAQFADCGDSKSIDRAPLRKPHSPSDEKEFDFVAQKDVTMARVTEPQELRDIPSTRLSVKVASKK